MILRSLVTCQRTGPRIPPQFCVGGELYCTMTFTVLDGDCFDSSARKSGEIFESSANAAETVSKTSHKTAHGANRLAYLEQKDCMALIRQAMRRLCVLPLLFLLAGFCGATLLRVAPGFGVDEREIDGRLSAESIALLRGARANERNLFTYYARYLAGVVSGDLGVSRSLERP